VPRDQPELLSDSGGGICPTWSHDQTPPPVVSLNLPAILLPVSFAGQRLLGPELLARLQIEGMPFDLFDDVFLLNLPLEAAKGVFKRFALLKLNFCQTKYTSQLDQNSHARFWISEELRHLE
jgi:hypothetical protein